MAPFATNSSFHLCSNTSCTQLTVWHALGCNASVVVHFLQFALTAIHGSEEHWKAGKDWEHSSHEWLQDDIWGVGSNHKGLNTERASCLECLESGLTSGVLKPSQTDHELIQELLNRLQAPTSYVPLTSTWHHSCHECSKPFPDFHYSSASVDYCQCKLKKKWGLLGNETKHWSDNQYNESVTSSVAIDLMLPQDSAQFVHAHFHPELHLVKNVWTLCFQGPEVKGVVVTVGYQTALCMCVCVRVYVFECVCVCVCAYVFVCAYKSDAENFTKLFLCNTV